MNPRRLRRVVSVVAVGGLMAVGPSASAVPGRGGPSYITRCGIIDVQTGARTCSYTFVHSRDVETFVVPPTKGPIEITAVGAPGFGEDTVRSRGARVSGSFPLLSGTLLFVTVGGDGYYDGYNGGQDGGGGASDVRVSFPDFAHRIIVAGGGGGAGDQLIFDQENSIWRFIVVRGGDAGQPGLAAGAGQPGTDAAGGAGGGNGTERGQAGSLGRGGHAADRGGGGGGGGYYGGGGGGGCLGGDQCEESKPGSGGGGSSLVPPGGSSSVSSTFEPSVTITVTQYG